MFLIALKINRNEIYQMLTLDELSERTDLKVNYIRRCMKALSVVLSPHVKRGDNNSLLFDEKSLPIFKEVKALQEDGLTLAAIKERLEGDLNGRRSVEKVTAGVCQTPVKSDERIYEVLDAVMDLQARLSQEKDKVFQEREARLRDEKAQALKVVQLEQEIKRLQDELKRLPDGMDPEALAKEWEDGEWKRGEFIRLLAALKETGAFSYRKRRKLIEDMERLISREELDQPLTLSEETGHEL